MHHLYFGSLGIPSDTCTEVVFVFFTVDGFLFLLLGTALYNQLLIIPPLMPKPDPPQQVMLLVEFFFLGDSNSYTEMMNTYMCSRVNTVPGNPGIPGIFVQCSNFAALLGKWPSILNLVIK